MGQLLNLMNRSNFPEQNIHMVSTIRQHFHSMQKDMLV